MGWFRKPLRGNSPGVQIPLLPPVRPGIAGSFYVSELCIGNDALMQITLRHQPAYTVARVQLDPNEALQLEAGAMVAMSSGVELTSKMEGGFLKSLSRSVLGGDSFFISTITAGANGGWVDLAPGLPGDIITLPSVSAEPWMLTRSSWLATTVGVTLDAKWGGFKNLFGGEGGFLVYAQGDGNILLNCYGALDIYDLAAGESLVLDSGHLVAMSSSVNLQLKKVASGWMNTIKSGEGLVFEIVGPGRVYAQTRNPTWFRQFAPAGHSHGGR